MSEKNINQSSECSAKTLIELLERLPRNFLFRGEARNYEESDAGKTPSSLYRIIKGIGNEKKALIESDQNTLAYHKKVYPGGKLAFEQQIPDIDILAYLRHFDQAVNVIDFSESPYVALYFACVQEMKAEEDGRIILLDKKKMKKIKKEDYPNSLPEGCQGYMNGLYARP